MRKNEYTSLNQFLSQYTGVWNPSENHWFGLDFKYNGNEYRFNTGAMYDESSTLPDGRDMLFTLYRKKETHSSNDKTYELLGKYADINDVLNSSVIDSRSFKDIIMDADTELVGQD